MIRSQLRKKRERKERNFEANKEKKEKKRMKQININKERLVVVILRMKLFTTNFTQ